MDDPRARFRREDIGDVTVVILVDKKVTTEETIRLLGNQLFALVNDESRTKVVLDLSCVEFFSSAALGMLMNMAAATVRAGGGMRLCEVSREIREVFGITGVESDRQRTKRFIVHTTKEEAIRSF